MLVTVFDTDLGMKNHIPRIDARVAVTVVVNVETESRLQQFYSKNLSGGGIFLEIPGALPVLGTKLKLSFEVPALKRMFMATGEVIHHHRYETMDEHCRDKTQRHGVGLQFLDLNREDREIIRRYISGKALHVHT